MPARIGIPDRVRVRVPIPIPSQRTARLRDDRIRRNEPAQPGAVPARGIPVQPQAALLPLARVALAGGGCAVGVTRFAPGFITQLCGFAAAARGSDAG